LILIASLVEAYDDFLVDAVANSKLALATISLSLCVAFDEFGEFQLRDLYPFFEKFVDLVVPKELSVVVLNYSVQILLFPLDLLFIGHRMQRFNYIFNFCIPHLLPILLSGLHFSFLRCPGALFNGHELMIVDAHTFLHGFGLDSFAFGKFCIKLIHGNGRAEFDDKE
jgi:hypothetical protein